MVTPTTKGLSMAGSQMPDCLRIDNVETTRVVTFNRPERRNAVDHELHEALAGLWSRLEADPQARAVVLTGAGEAFSAGGDLDYLRRTAEDEEFRYRNMRQARRIVTEMIDFPLPVIAAVNGPAVGLGCSVALLSDVVFAARSASFIDPHVSIGLVAGDGGALAWPLLTSLLHAKEYLLTGDRIDAETAARLGMVNHVVDDADLMPQALALAERFGRQPQQALRDTKRALNIHLRRAVDAVIDFAFAAEAETFTSDEFRTRLQSRR
jgi:enoyl-CoA hydratase